MAADGKRFVNELQTSVGKTPKFAPKPIAPTELLALIETWTEAMGRSRAVLLMDDAAHAFMQQQQREFFEVFRALRSRTVACKAAIYPGVTSYSPFSMSGTRPKRLKCGSARTRPTTSKPCERSLKLDFQKRFRSQCAKT